MSDFRKITIQEAKAIAQRGETVQPLQVLDILEQLEHRVQQAERIAAKAINDLTLATSLIDKELKRLDGKVGYTQPGMR